MGELRSWFLTLRNEHFKQKVSTGEQSTKLSTTTVLLCNYRQVDFWIFFPYNRILTEIDDMKDDMKNDMKDDL